jgi:NADH-quinone oxidoreductase subunit K
VLFILTVAACEAALALALILMLFKRSKSLDVSLWQELREPDQEPIEDEEPLPEAPLPAEYPHLPPAGPQPKTGSRSQETSHV